MKNFDKWLDTLLEEKGIDPESTIAFDGPSAKSGTYNFMMLDVVVEALKNTSPAEQAAVKNMLVKIDFVNGDVVDYLRHLAGALVL